MSADTYTVLLLHMNDADTSTTFTDSSNSGKTVTVNGNAQIDTAQSKFGGSSGLFDGTGDYLSIADSSDFYFASGDMTIDFWVRFNTLPALGSLSAIYCHYQDANNRFMFSLYQPAPAGNYRWYFLETEGGVNNVIKTWEDNSVTTGVWYHVAFVKNGSTWKVFRDGTAVGTSLTYSTSIADFGGTVYLGTYDTSQYFLDGWLEEFRVSKGIARWTSDFTPPSAEFSSSSSSSSRSSSSSSCRSSSSSSNSSSSSSAIPGSGRMLIVF